MRFLRISCVAVLALLISGCGNNSVQPNTNATTVLVNMGDAPADRFVEFSAQVNSITLLSARGSPVELLSQPVLVEFIHRAGTMAPVAINQVPQGTYESATISLSYPYGVYIADAGWDVGGPGITMVGNPVTVNLNPQLSVGASPVSLNLELNLAQSLSPLTPTNQCTFTPTFEVSAKPIADPAGQQTDAGKIEHLLAIVTGVSAPSFTVHVRQAPQDLTFATNGSTQFEGVAGLSSLQPGMVIVVDGATSTSGLSATRVSLRAAPGGLGARGVIDQGTSKIIVHEAASTNPNSPDLNVALYFAEDGATAYSTDDAVSLAGLDFAVFDGASRLALGQEVEIATDVSNSASITGSRVRLMEQALTGTVSVAPAPSGSDQLFTIQLPADSYLHLLAGASTVTVVQRTSTRVDSSPAMGAVMRVVGLLFYDSTAGQYKLVASRITAM